MNSVAACDLKDSISIRHCAFTASSSWDALFKASVASTLVAFNSLWDCATWICDSPITLLASDWTWPTIWRVSALASSWTRPAKLIASSLNSWRDCWKALLALRIAWLAWARTKGSMEMCNSFRTSVCVNEGPGDPSGPIPCPSGVWIGFLGTFGECSADCQNRESVPSGLWFGFVTFCNWFGFLSSGVDIDAELIGSDGVPALTWSALVQTTLSDLDLSSLSELSLPILDSNSDILPQLRDLCHDFTNDVPFTIFEILLNFARCSRRCDEAWCDWHEETDNSRQLPHNWWRGTSSASPPNSHEAFRRFRSSDVWSPRSWWGDSNLECYCCSQSSYFSSLRSRDDCQIDPLTSSATRDSPTEQLWLPKPIGSETCRLPDANEDTSNTFCWLTTLSILPMRPQNHGSRSPSRFPYCPRSSIERFPEDCTEESTPAQQSLVSLSLEARVIEILLDLWAFAPTLPSSWPLILLEVGATETILDGPKLDAASITCLGTGDGSFRAAVIFTLCSVSTTCWDALANFGTEPLESSPLQSQPLEMMMKLDSTERPDGGPAGSSGKFGNSTQLGGWAGSRGRETSSVSSSSSHWSSASPMTSHLTGALELLKKLSSRMYGCSLENAPLCNPCSRTATFWDCPLRPDRCQSTARQRTSPIEVIFAPAKKPIQRQLKVRKPDTQNLMRM